MNKWRKYRQESPHSTELDSLEDSRLQNVCEMDGRNGLPVCNSLNLALSLLLPFMRRIAGSVGATEFRLEGRTVVGCPVCKRQRPLSLSFDDYQGVVSWLRSLAVLGVGDTSIISQTTLRRHGRAERDAFGVWPDANTSVMTVAGVLLDSGKSS